MQNIVQILLYILYKTQLEPKPVFLVIVHAFCRLLILPQNICFFFLIILSNIILRIPMLNSLYLDQARIFVKPDLGPQARRKQLQIGGGTITDWGGGTHNFF